MQIWKLVWVLMLPSEFAAPFAQFRGAPQGSKGLLLLIDEPQIWSALHQPRCVPHTAVYCWSLLRIQCQAAQLARLPSSRYQTAFWLPSGGAVAVGHWPSVAIVAGLTLRNELL